MRLSRMLLQTQKENPRDAVSPSHQLLIRAGYIHSLSAGVYAYLPLMWKVIRKIEQIIREEMDKKGAIELNMPILQPRSIWNESGRWEKYLGGKFLFHLTDRRGEEHCIAPTSEEAITDIVRSTLKSYRNLPVILYQMGTKFRDELRPRFGIIRTREFIMKDGYSFDLTEDGLHQSFNLMKDAYQAIFARCGIDVRMVEADSGDIGGSMSTEFMLPTGNGEDTILSCQLCHYGANIEKATSVIKKADPQELMILEEKLTPGITKIEDLSNYLELPTSQILKTVLYQADNQIFAVLIRGDMEVNERKLGQVIGASYFEPADNESILNKTGTQPGFIGPINLSGVTIIADESVTTMNNFVCGANKMDYHFLNVNFGRDLPYPEQYVDVRNARSGDHCPHCEEGMLQMTQGVEIAHIFQLGTKYSEPMHLTIPDQTGQSKPVQMGCYGIGIPRIAAGAIEQLYDEHGISWPEAIAPYRVIITPISYQDTVQMELAETIYQSLISAGQEALLDDRDISPGSKFSDADLIGIPWRVTVGRKANEGLVEIKNRKTGLMTIVSPDQIISTMNNNQGEKD